MIAEVLSIWVDSTVLLSSSSAVVMSKLSFAVRMNESEVSTIRPRSGPVPLNAAPSSSTTVGRLFLFTELTVVSRSVSSLVVSIGVRVIAVGISDPSAR